MGGGEAFREQLIKLINKNLSKQCLKLQQSLVSAQQLRWGTAGKEELEISNLHCGVLAEQ